MGILRKVLSIALGSPEETLINAKAETSRALGSDSISNSTEKEYIFDCLSRGIKVCPDYGTSATSIILAQCIDKYMNQWNKEQMQILNRVLVHYYGYRLNVETLPNAINLLTQDLVSSRKLLDPVQHDLYEQTKKDLLERFEPTAFEVGKCMGNFIHYKAQVSNAEFDRIKNSPFIEKCIYEYAFYFFKSGIELASNYRMGTADDKYQQDLKIKWDQKRVS